MNHVDENGRRLIIGKRKGWVRDNADPENRGRVRCFCPQVMGPEDDETHWLGWAMACLPWLGGVNTLNGGPPLTKNQNDGVDVGVWLEFEEGHIDFPIWVGTFIPAPLPDSPFAQIDLATSEGATGGSILDNPSEGSDLSALNPPKPILGANEARIMTKEGQDIVIGSQNGAHLILGPSGAHIVAPQITINGRLMDANTADGVVG